MVVKETSDIMKKFMYCGIILVVYVGEYFRGSYAAMEEARV